ncbi:MAG: integrase catalytic domain-containing protein [Bacteroidetes bacterium]|nr:integrase catalytic domain-containing protein [Bacteroidota bacterium]
MRNRNNIPQYVKASRIPEHDHDSEYINQKLFEFKNGLTEFFKVCERERISITREVVKDYFKGKISVYGSKKDFFEAWDEYLVWGTEVRGKKYNSTRGIKTTGELLRNFQDDTEIKLTFENIDLELYASLRKYILDDKCYAFNYFASTIRRFKAFLNSDFAEKFYKGSEHKKFKAEEVVGTLVYLTKEELSKLYHHQFQNPKYERVRDAFVFACLTGLRISDWNSLTRANIVGDKIVRKIQKTGKQLELPLLPEAMAILKKYEHQYKALPKISDQKFNDYIKEACKEVEINTPVEVEPIRKGESKMVFPKYELIGSHVARKTFVTGMVKRGFEIELIMEFATIGDHRTLKRYLHLDNDYKREQLKKFGSL